MGAFANIINISSTFCPWCISTYDHRTAVDLNSREELDNLKQHYRQHMYEDLQDHKMSNLEIRKQQQRQLQEYLEGLLLLREDLPLDKAS